jgi:Tfp pilus assembly protein PilO
MPDNNTQQPAKKANVVPKTEVSMSEDKATRRFIAIMISVIVVTVLVGGAVLYWLIGKYVFQTNKNKAQDQTIYLLQQKQTNLQQLKPNYDAITAKGASGKSDADLILNAMPVDEGFRELIAQLERMGQESGVRVSTISKATTSSTGSTSSSVTKSYDVTVNMEGDFPKILEFLRKTEKSSRVLDFVSMNTSKASTGSGSTATATFRAYYQGPADIKPTEKELQ